MKGGIYVFEALGCLERPVCCLELGVLMLAHLNMFGTSFCHTTPTPSYSLMLDRNSQLVHIYVDVWPSAGFIALPLCLYAVANIFGMP